MVIGELGRWSTWAAVRGLKARLGSTLWTSAHHRSAAELAGLLAAAGLEVESVRGAIFYPPVGLDARLLAGMDGRLGHHTTLGAAFIAVAGTKPGP